MSDLFPDRPNHRPIQRVTISAKEATVGACLGSAILWACPKLEHHHDHAAHESHAEVPHEMDIAVSTGGGTSEVFPVGGNTLDAAMVAIRAGYARRNAQTRAAIVASQLLRRT